MEVTGPRVAMPFLVAFGWPAGRTYRSTPYKNAERNVSVIVTIETFSSERR